AQWSYSFLVSGRHIDTGFAAAAVSVYWWAQTAVRSGSGFIAERVGPARVIQGSLAAALTGAAALWWAPDTVVLLIAVMAFGAGLAPIFPTLVSMTPARFGPRAAEVVGYQVAAATMGGVVLAALVGVVLQRWGLRSLPPLLVVGVLATAVLYQA